MIGDMTRLIRHFIQDPKHLRQSLLSIEGLPHWHWSEAWKEQKVHLYFLPTHSHYIWIDTSDLVGVKYQTTSGSCLSKCDLSYIRELPFLQHSYRQMDSLL